MIVIIIINMHISCADGLCEEASALLPFTLMSVEFSRTLSKAEALLSRAFVKHFKHDYSFQPDFSPDSRL